MQVKGQQTADQVVDTALKAIRSGKTKAVSGLTNFIGALIGKHAPNALTTRAIGRALRAKYQKQ